ncbi:MAG: shikimate kinase [Caldimonas sp.]
MALVGLPGVGKSTIGRRLAAHLERDFFDTDELIEKQVGLTVAEIFEQRGEAGFRRLESLALLQVADEALSAVVATGGGIVTSPDSRDFLRQRTFAVFLRSPPQALVARIARSSKRPLLRAGDVGAKLALLHEQRVPLYRNVASLEIDIAGQSSSRVARLIADSLAQFANAAQDR